MSDVIEAAGVHKSFGGIVPAKNVNFAVRGGQLRCLIGPNGAGKSTLFKLIVGIENCDRGHVRLFGDDVTREPTFRRIRRGIGVKLQSNHAYKSLSMDHNIRVADFFAGFRGKNDGGGHGAGMDRGEALELFGLSSLLAINPVVRNLTHAEQQWLEICCSISPSVGILLLDEPTAGMGTQETHSTGQALRALQQSGMTIVVVEHDMEFVREVADYVTVLHQGEVFAQGEMQDLASRDDVRDIYLG